MKGMTDPQRLMVVGRIAGAFGVKGEVRIRAYTDDPMALLEFRSLRRADGSAGLTLISGRTTKGDFIGRAGEIGSKEEADALRGVELFVTRSALAPTDEEEFYQADLIGLAAATPGGESLGTVKAVLNFGAGDLLEIAPALGPTWMVAFTRTNAPQIDFDAGRIVIVRPEESE